MTISVENRALRRRNLERFAAALRGLRALAARVQPAADPPGGANVYAAFPSYHVGWVVAAAIVTANHYVIDVVGGMVIAGLCLVACARFTDRAVEDSRD